MGHGSSRYRKLREERHFDDSIFRGVIRAWRWDHMGFIHIIIQVARPVQY